MSSRTNRNTLTERGMLKHDRNRGFFLARAADDLNDLVLEIAEAVQLMKTKPKRSMVFVWHTAENCYPKPRGGLITKGMGMRDWKPRTSRSSVTTSKS